MCGRFTLKTPVADWLANLFPSRPFADSDQAAIFSTDVARPRYNIAPTQQILVARCKDRPAPEFVSMRWGLVPPWADSLSGGYNMFNARSETLADKPSFRPSLIGQRCIVLADGYYEWKKVSTKTKEPYWIHRPGETVFAMAGLWTENRRIPSSPGAPSPLLSATIITTASNEDTRDVHDRMPAIFFNEEQIESWLNPDWNNKESIDRLLEQLQPSPLGNLQMRRVSTQVNRPLQDVRELLDAVSQPTENSL